MVAMSRVVMPSTPLTLTKPPISPPTATVPEVLPASMVSPPATAMMFLALAKLMVPPLPSV